jgi:hypothetical protein
MPTYVYKCSEGHEFDIYLPLKDYNTTQKCTCGRDAKRITVPTMLSPDIAPWDAYVSPATGKYITSYKERRSDMKESGCVDYEPSLRKNFKKHQREDELKLEKSIDETVEREYEKLPSQKKEMLERELTNGADLEYTRGIVNE